MNVKVNETVDEEVVDSEVDSTDTTPDSGYDWADIGEPIPDDEDESSLEEEGEGEVEPAAPAAQAAEPASAPAPAESAAAPEPVTPPSAEGVQPPTGQQVEGQPSAPTPPQPESMSATPEQLAEYRTKAIEEIANYYKFSDDEAEALQERPHEVLPKLAARMYMDLFDNMTQVVRAEVPRLMQQMEVQTSAVRRAEDSFYSKWKALKTDVGMQAVNRIGRVYRQVNPNATLEEFIDNVGLQAMVALRLPLEGYSQPEAPAAPVVNSAIPPATPRSRPMGTARPTNAFEALADEFLIDED